MFLDADVERFGAHYVSGLLGPVLLDVATMLVKACYRRPFGDSPTGGGRVTELVARPVLSLLFPELTGVLQPLAGEVAVRREALDQLKLADGYGVEIAMLIDISRRYGTGSIAQVDLEVRAHRNRPLNELAPQARDVLEAALCRAGMRFRVSGFDLVVVSNRGPFTLVDGSGGSLEVRQAAGGMAPSLSGALAEEPVTSGTGALWVAAALTEAGTVSMPRRVLSRPGRLL